MVNKIYELSYLPLLTPYNLLDNLKLDNYKSVSYKKVSGGLLAEISCLIDDCIMTFYYEFDLSNYLSKVYYYENDTIEFLFDREVSLSEIKKAFCDNKAVI